MASKKTFAFVNQDLDNRMLSDSDRRTIRGISRRVGAATTKQQSEMNITTSQQSETPLKRPSIATRRNNPRGRTSRAGNASQGTLSQQKSRQTTQRGKVGLLYSPFGQPLSKDISVLTHPNLTVELLHQAVKADVNSDPRRWLKICRMSRQALLPSLPQMYGHSKCLDDAIACVSLRIQQMFRDEMRDSGSRARTDGLYSRAICSLASALDAPCVKVMIWYSTLLLALFELLDHSTERAWIMHSRGAFDVLCALGPENITTSAEMDMLVAQTEMMVSTLCVFVIC
jgi:hypothetical protein